MPEYVTTINYTENAQGREVPGIPVTVFALAAHAALREAVDNPGFLQPTAAVGSDGWTTHTTGGEGPHHKGEKYDNSNDETKKDDEDK